MADTVQAANVYGGYHSKQTHVALRRANWDEWRALPSAARGQQQRELRDERMAQAGPYVGVTTNGIVRPNLFSLRYDVSTRPLVDAAREFQATLAAEARNEASFPIDAQEWRIWINALEPRMRHGAYLEDLDATQKESALRLIRTSLSVEGFARVQNVMRLNRILGEITGDTVLLNEWRYHLSLFGSPGPDQPWGWQLDGHHLNVNLLILPGQLVLTPCFMGAEPRTSDRPPFPDARAFDREQDVGLELVRALSPAQRETAVLFPSMRSDALPAERRHASEGRMQAGAFRDNAVMPYEGVRAEDLTPGQRGLLLDLIGVYTGMLPTGHDSARQREIAAHLHETWFAWIGTFDDQQPFFYKIQSPVLLVEFDHHSGVFLDNNEPERFHAHSVVRTPNGNDYGKDLLRQHYVEHHDYPQSSH